MGKEKYIRFNFDVSVARKFRDAVNDHVHNVINKASNKINKFDNHRFQAWNQLCVAMDRIEFTLDYINTLELGRKNYLNDSYDFYEYIHLTAVVIDAIRIVCQIFDKSDIYRLVEESSDCFNYTGYTNNGNDKKFFEYIRSLVTMHPLNTNRHNDYIKAGEIFHVCPYVAGINQTNFYMVFDECKEADYAVIIYPGSQIHSKNYHIFLKIDSFKKYTNKWIDCLNSLIIGVKEFSKSIDADYSKILIKKEDEFDNYDSYLDNLINEQVVRYGDAHMLKEAKMLINISKTIKENDKYIEKYLGALKYAIKEHHKLMQGMDRERYSGSISIEYPLTDHLINKLIYLPLGKTEKYNNQGIFYADSKMYLLIEDDYYDSVWARNLCYRNLQVIINDSGLKINDGIDNEELYLIYNVSLYVKALKEDLEYIHNIPKEFKFDD